MAWTVAAIAGGILTLLAISVIFAQREVLTKQRGEIVRLKEAVDSWASDYKTIERANERMIDRYFEVANRDPIIIDPPDVASIVRELGDSIGTAIYGKQQEALKDSDRQVNETSMVEQQFDKGEWFPDVEFDRGMGPTPVPGGFTNAQATAQTPPPEGQTPSHVVVNGRLVRLDGQSLFQAGVTAPAPQGGVE